MRFTRTSFSNVVCLALAFLATSGCDDAGHIPLELPAIFGDHMVLQSGAPVPVWGWANEGEVILVSVAGQERTATAEATGRWKLTLNAMEAGGPHRFIVVGSTAHVFEDVWIGEVWLGSGQSNMAMEMRFSRDFETERLAANRPQIRMFREESGPADEPQTRGKGQWRVCSPDTVDVFSAALYYFGRDLQEELGGAVGLIDSSMGGTPIESWISEEKQRATPALAPAVARYDSLCRRFDPEEAAARYASQLTQWRQEVEVAEASGKKIPFAPADPIERRMRQGNLGGLYHGKIAPLIPYRLRGMVWYQGEQNSGRRQAEFYEAQLISLVNDWRERWNQGAFPIAWVQLPGYAKQSARGDGWPKIREAQRKALVLPNTGMAITIDIGEADNIHPRNKREVGRRLAAWALGEVYGRGGATSGPLFRSLKVRRSGRVIVQFDHQDGGLKGPEGDLGGFELQGEDGVWHPARAHIQGKSVAVTSRAAKKPIAVRYAWARNPTCSLFNGAGLPASPFSSRTKQEAPGESSPSPRGAGQ